MRLLHVITSMNPESGGPAQGIRNLDKSMKSIGVIREVVCLDKPDSSYLGTDDFVIHAVGPGKGPWNYASKLTPWLRNNILKFDVVIINGLWLYNSYATWKVLNDIKRKSPYKKSPKLLVMPHGMLDPYFQKAKDRRLKAIRNWIYWKLIERKVVNDADGLLFTCETELLLARQSFTPYHPKNEYNVGYGIQPPPPFHQQMAIAFKDCCQGLNDEPYLLFISRLHPKKGLDLLIKAYINLRQSTNVSGIVIPKLVIAGPGLDSRFGKILLQELTNIPEVSADIFFPGMLSGDVKWGAFYGCDAFILPSHQENFGIAVVEALACSKPVLISNQVNIWREIENEGAGIIEDDNLEGTEKMFKKWLNLNNGEKENLNKNAFIAYQNLYTVDKAVQHFLRVATDLT